MDFWSNHGWWFLLGCIFAPRIIIAYVATVNYWQTNPTMVVFAWIFAFMDGEHVRLFKTSSDKD